MKDIERKSHVPVRYVLVLFFLIIIYLSFHQLGNLYYWDDEAEVGIIAKNFLASGQLSGWDGRNLYAFSDGGALDTNLRTRNPPLDILVCALSFKFLRVSNESGRFLFVVIGILALGIFVLLIKNDFGEKPWLWFYMLGVFALSPVFLLNIRQCRYYALSLLLSLLSYYAYRRSLSTKRVGDFLIVTVSSILAFYANPMTGIAFVLALGFLHIFFHRQDYSFREWKIITLMIFLFLITTVPYAIYYRIWDRPDHIQNFQEPWLVKHLNLIGWNLRDLNTMTCMPWPIFLGLVYLFVRYRKDQPELKTALEWGVLAVLNVLFIALISPQQTYYPGLADIRYLISSVPFLLGLVGIFLWYVHRWSCWVALTLMSVVVMSNLLTLTPANTEFRWLLPGYLYEIHHDYPTPYSAAVHYLEAHAKQDDLVRCYPDIYTYPLMFYLSDKIKFCCMMDNVPFIPMDVIENLHAPLLNYENFPEWIILFGYQQSFGQELQFYSRPHLENGILVQYTYEIKNILNITGKDTSRPELPFHHFGPVRNFNAKSEAVCIIKRKDIN